MPVNTTKVLALLNEANETTIQPGQVRFSTPETNPVPEATLNTQSRVSTKKGGVVLHYERWDFQKMFKNLDCELKAAVDEVITTESLVAKVVAKYGVSLTVEDVLPIGEVNTATLPVLVTLVADPAGFNWTGQLDLLLVV